MPAMLKQLVAISEQGPHGLRVARAGQRPGLPEPAAAAETTTDAKRGGTAGGGRGAAGGRRGATGRRRDADPCERRSGHRGSGRGSLPIGATVGSAGLSVLPYDVRFTGEFFEIADLFEGVDQMVRSQAAKVEVDGRLVTVNGFTMKKEDTTDPLRSSFRCRPMSFPSPRA